MCRKRWMRCRGVSFCSSNEATALAAPVRTFSNSCGAGRPAGEASLMASSFVSRLSPLAASLHFVGARNFSRAPQFWKLMRLSAEPHWKSTPAELQTFLDADRGHALDGVIRDELFAGVLALRLRARLDVGGDRLDPVGGHEKRILLRGRADDAVLDPFDALAAAVDRNDGHAFLLASSLERRVAAVGGGLVDRVDKVDVVRFLEDVLHRLAPAFG